MIPGEDGWKFAIPFWIAFIAFIITLLVLIFRPARVEVRYVEVTRVVTATATSTATETATPTPTNTAIWSTSGDIIIVTLTPTSICPAQGDSIAAFTSVQVTRRRGPGTSYASRGYIDANSGVIVIARSGDSVWARILQYVNGKPRYGWVEISSLLFPPCTRFEQLTISTTIDTGGE